MFIKGGGHRSRCCCFIFTYDFPIIFYVICDIVNMFLVVYIVAWTRPVTQDISIQPEKSMRNSLELDFF